MVVEKMMYEEQKKEKMNTVSLLEGVEQEFKSQKKTGLPTRY